MNIKELHNPEKTISNTLLFQGKLGKASAIQLLNGEHLKEHITTIEALVICIIGKIVFQNEKGMKRTLEPGDYLNIEAHVKHWVDALADSQLLILK